MAIETANRVTLGGMLCDARHYEDRYLELRGIAARLMTNVPGGMSFVLVLFPHDNGLAERLQVAADITGMEIMAPWPDYGLPARFYGDGHLDVLLGGRLVTSGVYGPRPPETLVVVDAVTFRSLPERVRKLLAKAVEDGPRNGSGGE